MRSHHDEHADALPKVDITALRHVAYIMDAFIYYVRSREQSGDSNDAEKKDDGDVAVMESSKVPKVEGAVNKLNNIPDPTIASDEPKTGLVMIM